MLAPLAAVLLGVLASAATALAAEPAVVAPGRVALFEGGANTVAAMADGRALLAGGSGDSLVVVRLGAGGTPDPTFGAGGTVRLRLPELERIVQLLAQPDGGVVVIAGGRSTGTCFETPVAVVRLTAAGTLDGTFGEHGVATPKIGAYCFPRPAAAMAADGSIVIAGSTGVYDRDLKPAVAKLTPAGRLDERFGGDGIVELPSGGLVNIAASTAAIAPGGRIVVIYPDHLAALTAGGVLDPAFHHGAPVSLAGCELIVARPDGSIDALVTAPRSKRISRVTSAGVLDRAFGAGGTVKLAAHDGDSPLRLFVAADGATTLFETDQTLGLDARPHPVEMGVYAVSADGSVRPPAALHLRFGGGAVPSGVDMNIALGQNGFSPEDIAARPDGSYVVAGSVRIRYLTEGGGRGVQKLAAAAFTPALAPDRSFGGPAHATASLHPRTSRVTTVRARGALPLLVTASAPGMVRLTLRDARGAVVGRKVVPLFHGGAIKLSVRLTPRALRLLRRAGPRRLTVTHEFRDVVAGSARGTTAVALR